MLTFTLADLRNSKDFFKRNEIIRLFDGRKKEELGYFVPRHFSEEFRAFLEQLERKRKKELLRRVAKAQRCDPIEEGAIDDGLA